MVRGWVDEEEWVKERGARGKGNGEKTRTGRWGESQNREMLEPKGGRRWGSTRTRGWTRKERRRERVGRRRGWEREREREGSVGWNMSLWRRRYYWAWKTLTWGRAFSGGNLLPWALWNLWRGDNGCCLSFLAVNTKLGAYTEELKAGLWGTYLWASHFERIVSSQNWSFSNKIFTSALQSSDPQA